MSDVELQNSYDRVPYRSAPFPQTHPSRIGAIARLFGMEVATTATMRVLELGCASGGNLIPLAQVYPEASFLGIDASGVQIEMGQKTIAEAGLRNVELRQADIADFQPESDYDFIICHGVYSWVPERVQSAILRICQQHLSPIGLAYISYNTFPGWKMRGTIRDIMRFRARSFDAHEDQLGQARTFLEFLTNSVGGEQSPYAMMLRRELNSISQADDFYLLHEHLEEINSPLYFYEFAERAAAFDLEYIAETDFGSCFLPNLPETVRSMLVSVSRDRIEVEQYLDFLRNRTFRQTILCRKDRQPGRQAVPENLSDLYVSSNAVAERPNYDFRSTEELQFQRRDSRLKTTEPMVKVAFSELQKRWPERIAFRDLASMARSVASGQPVPIDQSFMTAETRRFAQTLLQCYSTAMIDLHCDQSRCGPYPHETPFANELQVYQARTTTHVTTLVHTELPLDDFQRKLIQCCDGHRTRVEISQELAELVRSGELIVYGNQGQRLGAESAANEAVALLVDRSIDFLWKNGLLASKVS